MLAIGRALVTGPSLILLDEPSQGLAPMVVELVVDMLRELKSEGVSMLLVEQNLQMALDLAERVYILDQGEVVFDGSAQELKNNDQLTASYLGVSG
ncbi:MAG: High-affinity branched-chain amino acid transport ATP-binding protein LivF [Alphaproteobacteria bacterium MarineAlpha3_Bin3]|jgi:branched-chain amino acid transport system ATP-binding protein|nr:MAG: High-affinity branched-chain amino acid transport ATP-binding protein LivF [Alphaproteobacteria bacterium MarineAlpha3_Bin3]